MHNKKALIFTCSTYKLSLYRNIHTQMCMNVLLCLFLFWFSFVTDDVKIQFFSLSSFACSSRSLSIRLHFFLFLTVAFIPTFIYLHIHNLACIETIISLLRCRSWSWHLLALSIIAYVYCIVSVDANVFPITSLHIRTQYNILNSNNENILTTTTTTKVKIKCGEIFVSPYPLFTIFMAHAIRILHADGHRYGHSIMTMCVILK